MATEGIPSPTTAPNFAPVTDGTGIPPQVTVSGATDTGDLCAQLERVETKVGLVLALQASRRRRAILLALLLCCSACWFIWQVLTPFREIYQNPRSFTDGIEHEQRTIFLPILQHEVQKRVPKVYAAFDQSIQAEWNKRQPKLQALGHELNLLLGQVSQHLSQQGAVRVNLLLDRYQKRLEKDFPEIAKDEAALDNIHSALQSALTTVIGARFHRPFETVCAIRDLFLGMHPPEQLRKMNDAQLQEAMIELITVYANQHFGQSLESLKAIRSQLIALGDQILDAAQKLESEIPAFVPAGQKGEAR